MIRVVHARWETKFNLHKSFKDALGMFYKRIPQKVYDKESFSDTNIDKLLKEVAKFDVDWCVVHSDGIIYDDQTEIAKLFEEHIASLPEETLVTGQLIDKENQYCGIHEQCFAVNIKKYIELNYPIFGDYELKKIKLHNYIPGESIHDNYTPKTLSPDQGSDLYETWTCGWGIVNASMEAGLKIFNLPREIRNRKIYCYPDEKLDDLNSNLEAIFSIKRSNNINQNRMLLHLLENKLGLLVPKKNEGFKYNVRKKAIFIYNTEFLENDPDWILKNKQVLDLFLTPCSGLLEFSNLSTYGFHDETEIIYFDINEDAIKFKKYFWENFSGDFSELTDFAKAFAEKENIIIDIAFEESNMRELNSIIKRNGDDLKSVFNKIKNLKKSYKRIDLINNHKDLFRLINPGKKSLLCYSDIFLGQNELVYGLEKMTNSYMGFLELASHKNHLIISGKTVEDAPMICFSEDIRRFREFKNFI